MMKTLVILLLIFFFENKSEAKQSIIIQSTTSTKNSGFYNYILPIFEKKAGFKVHVVAVGTGAATLVTGADYDAVIGIRLCNILTSTIEVDVYIINSGNKYLQNKI